MHNAEPSSLVNTTIGDWMRQHRDLDRLDCELLLSEILTLTRAQIIGRPEHLLDDNALNKLNSWTTRLRNDEPMAYLTGVKEFWGLSFEVTPDVLIPRPETELLVELAIGLAREAVDQPRILDLGTGSGAIAVAVAHTLTQTGQAVEVYASDRSTAALGVARGNADNHDVSVHWLVSNWFRDIPHMFDLIVSNPPYVATNDPHLAALRHEPAQALCAGSEGLDALCIIVVEAHEHLKPGGWLLVEHGYNQEIAVQNLFAEQGFEHIRTERDLGGRPRVTQGSRCQ